MKKRIVHLKGKTFIGLSAQFTRCGLRLDSSELYLAWDSQRKEPYSTSTYATWPVQGETWRLCKNCLKTCKSVL